MFLQEEWEADRRRAQWAQDGGVQWGAQVGFCAGQGSGPGLGLRHFSVIPAK